MDELGEILVIVLAISLLAFSTSLLFRAAEATFGEKLEPSPLKETIPKELCIKGVLYYKYSGGIAVAISRSNQVIECNYGPRTAGGKV